MKIALVQINPVIGDFERQCKSIIAYAARAREKGCGLVIFPEMAVCGYPPKDLLERDAFVRSNQEALAHLIRAISGIGVLLGVVSPN